MASGRDMGADALETLSDAIHTMAQPLTALSFTVEIALTQTSPDAWKTALEHARNETRRAFTALEEVRAAMATMQQEKDSSWEPLQ